MSTADPAETPWWSPPYGKPLPRDPDCTDCAPHPRHLFEPCDRFGCDCPHSRELGIKTDAR